MRVLPLAVLMAALTLPAGARDLIGPSNAGRSAMARFNALDRNHDGRLTWDELMSHGRQYGADSLFLLLDANGDGRLSAREVEGKGGGGRLARFDAYDVDHNGYVTRREFPAFVDRVLFDALDRDHDGGLSLAELRPGFAGSGVRTARADEVPAAKPQRAKPAPLCWVPTPGSGRIAMEVPVTGLPCRTQ
ncbi:MAG: EF-hand domain-containing protein [Actinomycetota bacterium]